MSQSLKKSACKGKTTDIKVSQVPSMAAEATIEALEALPVRKQMVEKKLLSKKHP